MSTHDDRARAMLADPKKRLAYIARQRARLHQLEQDEAPLAKRAERGSLIESVQHAHAVLAVLRRELMVPN